MHIHILYTVLYLQASVHQGQKVRGTQCIHQMSALRGKVAPTILTQHKLKLCVLVKSAQHTAQAG